MKLDEIDKNLKVVNVVNRTDVQWYDVRQAPFRLYGLHDAENANDSFHRIPPQVAETVNEGVIYLNYNTAGARVRFATDSPFIALHCEYKCPMDKWSHMPLTNAQGFDLYCETADGAQRYVTTFLPPADYDALAYESERDVTVPKPHTDTPLAQTDMRHYTLNFPPYGTVKNLYVGIKEGCTLAAGNLHRNEGKPVVFYGSSITQGGCSSRPGTTYPAHLSAKYNLDYINLGFSGSARGESSIARYIAGLDMSAFVCDYDHNAPTAQHLRSTLRPFFEIVRAAHPHVPFIFASGDISTERQNIIRSEYERARAEGDRNVWHVDGAHLFDGEFAEDATVDTVHPNDLGFYRMFLAFEKPLVEALHLKS